MIDDEWTDEDLFYRSCVTVFLVFAATVAVFAFAGVVLLFRSFS